jgi:polyferredoxin
MSVVARRVELFAVAVRPYLPFLHAAMFVGFVTLIVGPAVLPHSQFAERLGHAANWLIWTLWFPLVFLSVIVTGRSWCGVLCPMGAASEWVNGFGLKRAVPGWLRWEGTPILTFLVVTILGQTVGVRDYAGAILEVFGVTMLAALVIGFLYGQGTKKRAWCRHACPIGLLLGVFSRLGAVDVTPKRPEPGGDAYDRRGLCPTMIDLQRKTESRHCVMCMRCVHPERPGALKIELRAPGAEVAAIRKHNPSLSEVWFMLLGTGVSLGGFLWLVLPQYQTLRQAVGAWAIDHGWMWVGMPGPSWLMVVHPEAREVFVWLDFLLIVGFMLAVMVGLTVLLAALQALAAWTAGRLGGAGDFRARFTQLGYQIAPAAMISLLLGLGTNLFTLLPHTAAGPVKLAALAVAVVWSAWLGWRIVSGLGLASARALAVALPGVVGAVAVAAAWWPAVAG